ncbi:MAG: hypothetical protein HY243_09945 [Proteobacteria bacterium]|nr:hypothetical protein [Pseudomonadota bacterium]
MASEQFDAYEYIGVIAPGAVLLVGIGLVVPEAKSLVGDDISLSGLGILAIVAFVVGHLVQAGGRLVELSFWGRKGMPTNWPLQAAPAPSLTEQGRPLWKRWRMPAYWPFRPAPLISEDQKTRLFEKVKTQLKQSGLTQISRAEWYGVVREIYAQVQAAQRTQRIDAFNRTYGMLRGVAASFMVLATVILVRDLMQTHDLHNWRLMLTAIVLALISIDRMYSFGVDYARELFVQYLRLA